MHLQAGSRRPVYLYGTAWKEDETRRLVGLALEAGFRGIDTANQRRHYHEAAVGDALADAFATGSIARDDVFIQTKFTFAAGQDHRLPYDPSADVATQVRQSFASSLEHLRIDSIDCLVLHGPSRGSGIHAEDLEAWRAMEEIRAAGGARHLGVSNISRSQLEELCRRASEPPAFVQNRCFARSGWDREVRALCRERGFTYQGFSLLTANPAALSHPALVAVARRLGRTPAQIVFRFAIQAGMLPLTGTTNPAHMRDDLACTDFELTDDDASLVENVATR